MFFCSYKDKPSLGKLEEDAITILANEKTIQYTAGYLQNQW